MQAEQWLEKHLETLEEDELAAIDWHNSCRGMSMIGGFVFGVALQTIIAQQAGLFDRMKAGNTIWKVSYLVVMTIPVTSAVLVGGYFRRRQLSYIRNLMDKYAKSSES